MALARWIRISTEIRWKNPWWSYCLDRYRLSTGYEGEYHYVSTPGSAMVIPVLEDGRIVMVKQYRYLNRRDSLEFPAGGVQEGTDAATTARNELEEETGYTAKEFLHLGAFNPFNGVTDEICQVYLARELSAGDSRPDVMEEFERVLLSRDDVNSMIANGTIWDGMSLAAWCLFLKRGVEL